MKLSNTFLYLGFIGVGCVIGVFLCNFSYFSFEKQISYFDLFSLCITTALGIYITVRIGRVFNKENSEKQLLIDEIKESIKTLDSINSKIESRSYSMKGMARDVKLINENLHLIDNLIKASHCRVVKLTGIRSSLNLFRRAVTGYPAINDMVTLSPLQFSAANRQSSLLRQKYFELIFDINRV